MQAKDLVVGHIIHNVKTRYCLWYIGEFGKDSYRFVTRYESYNGADFLSGKDLERYEVIGWEGHKAS